MQRDDHSNNYWLFAFADISAEIAAHSINDSWSAFGVRNDLISEGPVHFKNEVVCIVAKGLVVTYEFTLPYSNGAMRNVGKDFFRIFRAVRSELRPNGSE